MSPGAEGPFAAVSPLVAQGRFAEAARSLKRSAAAGAQAWETFLWLGRIEEGRGRPDAAERAYRRSAEANPGSPLPRVELSRLLEENGRRDEAQELLRQTAAQAAGELTVLSESILRDGPAKSAGENLYSLMEFNLYRRVFLDEVIRKGKGLDRIEAAMRSVLESVPQAGARTLLAEILLARGRAAAAETELAASFGPGSAGAETSRIEVLFKLIDRGRYGRALEGAVLDCLKRAGPGDKLALDWPQVFSALMCARKYREAFRLGEAMLDKFGRIDSPTQFLWPWWRKIRRAVAEGRFIEEELARLRRASRGGGFAAWFAYYRAVLLSDSARNDQAMAEYAVIRDLDAERYSWMLQSFVLVKLCLLDFDGAVEVCRAVLERADSHWWVRCRMAEALLAKGETAAALAEFEAAERSAGADGRKEVLTWHGEILLWLGDYARALAKFDEAVGLGARNFVFGWRGAARLLSGDREEALADLERAVRLDAKDFEARCWRGELYRLLGRDAESLADLDLVIRSSADSLWARANRGLLKASRGDEAGLRADFEAMPRQVVAYLAGTLGLAPGDLRRPAAMARVLEEGLRRAKGVRRWEEYAQRVWMGAEAAR